MKLVLIGTGNVATHLATALQALPVEIVQIWSHHHENAVSLATQIGATAIADLAAVDTSADVCLIAIKDDEIASVAGKLNSFKGVIAHTSGAVNLNVFGNLSASYGVLYPLQTFSKGKSVNFQNIPLCVEANNENTLLVLKRLAHQLSSNVVEVNSDKRKILHLAAVFACNFTNHMYALADKILKENSLSFELIKPLIAETADKIKLAIPREVQTGPAIRNDLETIQKHEGLLLEQPEMLAVYKILSESIKNSR